VILIKSGPQGLVLDILGSGRRACKNCFGEGKIRPESKQDSAQIQDSPGLKSDSADQSICRSLAEYIFSMTGFVKSGTEYTRSKTDFAKSKLDYGFSKPDLVKSGAKYAISMTNFAK